MRVRKKHGSQIPPKRKRQELMLRIDRFQELIEAYREAKYINRERLSRHTDSANAVMAIRRKMELELIPMLKQTTAHEVVKELGYTEENQNLIYPLRKAILKKGLVKESALYQSDADIVQIQKDYQEKRRKEKYAKQQKQGKSN